MTNDRIAVFDTTLRDGEQSPGCSMNLNEKVRMARQLEPLGVDIIEAGFPIASDGDFAAVKAVASRLPAGDRRRTLPHVGAGCGSRCRSPRRGRASAHSHLCGHFRHSSRTQTEEDSRRGSGNDAGVAFAWRATSRRRWSSPPRTRPAVTSIIFAKSSPRPSTQAPRSSTCRTRSATRCRPNSRDWSLTVRERVVGDKGRDDQRALPQRSRTGGRQ